MLCSFWVYNIMCVWGGGEGGRWTKGLEVQIYWQGEGQGEAAKRNTLLSCVLQNLYTKIKFDLSIHVHSRRKSSETEWARGWLLKGDSDTNRCLIYTLAPPEIGSLPLGFLGFQHRIWQMGLCFTIYPYQWAGLFLMTNKSLRNYHSKGGRKEGRLQQGWESLNDMDSVYRQTDIHNRGRWYLGKVS